LSLIDLTPDGRQEKEMGRNMYWVKHKEMYTYEKSNGADNVQKK